tara:strand:+ start:293 stop:934 length:642 start_codon:yes stop_codon:yes gene_type:complete
MKKVKVKPEKLKVGDTLLMGFRKIDSGKILVEVGERINARQQGATDKAIDVFNSSDYEPGIRRAWYPALPEDISKHFGLDVDKLKWTLNDRGQDIVNLNYLNPKALGKRLRIVIEESVHPKNEYQVDNAYSIAKKRGSNGDHCTHNGHLIFANTDVILTNDEYVKHTILPIDNLKYESIKKSSTPNQMELTDFEAFMNRCEKEGISVETTKKD